MFDIIIIGGGMAGMTSALYSLRNNKTVLILESEAIGGQIAKSPKVENYPTIKQISGMELADELFEQVTALGAEFALETVENIQKNDNIFTVTTDYATHQAKCVVVATGAKPRTLGAQNEDKFLGKGVYYCAICDGPFYAGKDVAVVGDANSALQYALMLAGYCKSVRIIALFDKLFGEKELIDSVTHTPNIEVIYNTQTLKFDGNDALSCVVCKNKNTNAQVEYKCDAVFVAIGQVPDNKILEGIADLDSAGYVVADETCTTKTPGLFVAGDCRTKQIRQVTTAVADGAVSAISACKYIDKLEGAK